MEPSIQNLQITEIEQTIQELNGVEAARIVANGQGIEEIHVLSVPHKNVKQLARDIESAIIAKHGVAVDYRKISIAQVSTDEAQQLTDIGRLKLKSIGIETSELTCRVSVTLFFNEKDFEGVAQGSSSSNAKRRLVAEATVIALNKACEKAVFSLEGLEVIGFGSHSVVCTLVSLLQNGKESPCTGSALKNSGQENEAIVKAVLSAINRRFNIL